MSRLASSVLVLAVGCASGPQTVELKVEVCPPARTATVQATQATHESTVKPGRETRGSLHLEGVPPSTPELDERVSAYQNARRARLAAISTSGGVLIRTRFGSSDQLHWVASPGAARRQLTFFKEPIGEVAVSKNPKNPTLLVSTDTGGNERYQIYRVEKDGRGVLITDGKSSNRSLALSNDGSKVAYMSTERNGKDFDVWVADVATGKKALVHQSADGWWQPLDWSPNDDALVVLHPISVTKSTLHVIVPGKGVTHSLQPKAGERDIAYGESAVFSADGKGLFFSSDQGRDTKALFYRDLEKETDVLVSDAAHWDVERIFADPQRRRIGVNINAGGFNEIRIFEARTKKQVAAPTLPRGAIIETALDADGRLFFTFESPKSPADVYSWKGGAKSPERWTESEPAGMRLDRIAEAELVDFPTFDTVRDAKAIETSRRVPAFVIRPAGAGPFPIVVLIHGGPEAQSRPMFSAQTAMLAAEMGIAVVQPNVRGSTGYGRAYTELDNGKLREDSVKDIGALLGALPTIPKLDPSRVALLGGSYGGFMVLASGIRYPDKISAIVDVVGISNFVTFLESTEPYRRDLRRVEYGDERDPAMRAFLESVSPLNRAHEISDPLFVVQGQNDPRVPVDESEQIVAKGRQNREVWYMLATNEGHGFRKKENQDAMMSAISAFLEKNLIGAKP